MTRLRHEECVRAAAAVLAAEHGREAVAGLRPRGIGGLVRSRPPLPLLLWLVSRQELLVGDADGLVVLEPPGGVRPRSARLSRAVDRWWEHLVFASVAMVLLLVAFVLAAAGLGIPALVVVALAVGWTAVWMVTGGVRVSLFLYQQFERSPRRSPDLARSAVHAHWRLALVHAADPRVLLGEALRQVDELSAAETDRRVIDESMVVCRQDAVTTGAARRLALAAGRVEELPGPEPVVVTVLREAAHQREEPDTVGGAGISVILLGLATTTAVLPLFVAGFERQACGSACEGRPTGYGPALFWLLPFTGDDTVHAATAQAKVLHALFLVLVGIVAVCLVFAVRRTGQLNRAEVAAAQSQLIGVRLTPAKPVQPPLEPTVFLNYRKEDGGWVAAIALQLRAGFEGVFRDSDSIPAGADFVDALLAAVRTSEVVVAVIGPGWVDARNPDGGRRLDAQDDWVRREIAEAFARGVTVLPVLVGGADRLTHADLPPDIAKLRTAQYIELRNRSDAYDWQRLTDTLQREVPGLRRRAEDGGRARSRAEIDAFLRTHLEPQQQRSGNRDRLVEMLAAAVDRTERLLAVAPAREALLVVTDQKVRLVGVAGGVREVTGAHGVRLHSRSRTTDLTLVLGDREIQLTNLLRGQADEVAAVLREGH